jgi:hypothetical protein
VLANARILLVAFVVSVAVSLAWQYHAAQRGAVESTTVDQAAASDEAGGGPTARDLQDNDSKVSNRHSREAASGDGKARNEDRAGGETYASMSSYEELFVYEYDEEWVADFYVDLHSLDVPLPDVNEDYPVISGRVLTPSGRPVSAIEITARPRDYFEMVGNEPAHRTITNDDGVYAFSMLPAGIYLVGTDASPQYSASRIEVRTGVKYADLVLEPQRMVTVQGVVTDPMGQKLGQVRIMPLVKGLPTGGVSNEDGEFAFGVALGETTRGFPLTFQLEGYREQRYQVSGADWDQRGNVGLSVTLEPVYELSTVSGSVTGPDGMQAVGDNVRLYSPGLKRNYTAVVDSSGEFLFAEVEAADDYQIWVRPNGPYRDFVENNYVVGAGSQRRDIVLEPLDKSHRISGRVLDQDGKSVPNFTLTLRSMAAREQRLPITTNSWGKFEVNDVPAGDLLFETLTMPFYRLSGYRIDGGYTNHQVDLVINRGRNKLVGKVLDEDGRPVMAPKVFITASSMHQGIQSRLSSSTSADDSGRFLFTDLGGGEHTITVTAPGYEGVRIKSVVGSQEELVVRLEKDST